MAHTSQIARPNPRGTEQHWWRPKNCKLPGQGKVWATPHLLHHLCLFGTTPAPPKLSYQLNRYQSPPHASAFLDKTKIAQAKAASSGLLVLESSLMFSLSPSCIFAFLFFVSSQLHSTISQYFKHQINKQQQSHWFINDPWLPRSKQRALKRTRSGHPSHCWTENNFFQQLATESTVQHERLRVGGWVIGRFVLCVLRCVHCALCALCTAPGVCSRQYNMSDSGWVGG